MPTWSGWQEQDVRQSSGTKATSRGSISDRTKEMAGFTAINGPSGASHPLASSSYGNGVICRARSYEGQLEHNQSTIAVSDSHGHGNGNVAKAAVKQITGPLCGLGSKKTATVTAPQGKKRGTSATKELNGKRRKISDVAQSMHVMKPASRGKSEFTKKDTPSGPPAASNPAPGSFHEAESNAAHSVSVFAPQTSMNTCHQSTNLTSLDAVRSSPGQSTTVYQGRQLQSTTARKARPVQPWLNHASSSSPVSGSNANTSLLHPRKAAQLKSAITSTPAKTRHVQGVKGDAQRTVDGGALGHMHSAQEDFLADEDNFNLHEALKLTQQAETTNEKPGTRSRQLRAATEIKHTGIKQAEAAVATKSKVKALSRKPTVILTPEEELMQLADDDEAELLEVTVEAEQSYRDKRLNLRNVDPHEDYGGLLLSDAERNLLVTLKATTSSNPPSHPIVLRKPFPTPIATHSPLAGAKPIPTLRTCFRLGEVLNAATQALRSKTSILVEMYARVTHSYREGRRQHFTFRDLWHENPPWLEGWSECWRGSRLWEADSGIFLEATKSQGGVLCRAVGKVRRDGLGKWEMDVLSIWEAGWEDVEFVGGIYGRQGG